MMHIEKYILCLDTDTYAGNFERETTAYATGVIGGCGVGSAAAAEAIKEIPQGILNELEGKIINDDDGNCCTIVPTPGWVNDGMGGTYRQSQDIPPTQEQVEVYRKAHRSFQLPHLKSARKYTAAAVANWVPDALEREEQRYREIETKTIVQWQPAYFSIGIYLNEPLKEDTLRLVVTRAKDYLAGVGVSLEQVRLITRFVDDKSEVLNVL